MPILNLTEEQYKRLSRGKTLSVTPWKAPRRSTRAVQTMSEAVIRKQRGSTPKQYYSSEQALQNAIITYLQYRHYWVMRINSGMVKTEHGGMVKMGVKGTPDVLAIKYGQAMWLEIKLPGKHSTSIQKARQDELRAAGCKVYEIHSLEELGKVL